MDLAQDRWESLKAGLIGAIATTIGFVLLLSLHRIGASLLQTHLPLGALIQPLAVEPDALLLSIPEHLGLGIRIMLAGFTGLLFGVTYRYVIRTDNNPQLKAGAIAAFGLVRGSAQLDQALIDHILSNPYQLGSLALEILESVMLLSIAGWAVDQAIRHYWIQPFSATFNVNGDAE